MTFQNINFVSYKKIIINYLLCFIPLSFIAGNLILNLNVVLICLMVMLFYGKKILNLKLIFFDKLIILFFLYIILNGIYNTANNFNGASKDYFILEKSFSYLRFLILYIIVKFLISEDKIIFKYFFLSFGFISLFVAIDVLIQFFFGSDIFGFEGSGRRFAGPFNQEYVAGSFIQRFSLFSFFLVLLFFKTQNKFLNNLLLTSVLTITLFGLIVAGNRVPLLMFLISMFLIIIFQKEMRKILFFMIFVSILSIPILMKSDRDFNAHYIGFVEKTYEISNYYSKKIKGENPIAINFYIKEFETGFETWKLNKYLGGGIKSFYKNCLKIDPETAKKWGGGNFKVNNCPNHPHNYHIQILAELGYVGYIIFLITFFLILFKSVKKLFNDKNFVEKNNILLPFVIIFIVEIFPFKTTGSFFTTSNATFIFFVIAFIVGLVEYQNENKK